MSSAARIALNPPLVPRKGQILRVLGISRISGPHQDERSLDDQDALHRDWLDSHYDGSYQLTIIASRGSGERLDRKEFKRARRLVRSKKFDLVLAEDLGRIVRRVHAQIFCELCEDYDTRLIALNDNVDTGQDNWELSSFFAAIRHATYNRDTARRIRRSLRNRFANGGVFQVPVFGYIKPEGATGDSDVHKDQTAEPIYNTWFQMLEDGATYAEVADWLNDAGVPVGPGSRTKRWSTQMVSRVTRNPILKGLRLRNKKKSKRVNRTGRRTSVDAPPEELLERQCSHLAFIDPQRYDRVIRLLQKRNDRYTAGRGSNGDPRRGRPKRTVWPGQHLTCGICGRLLRYGGHGQNQHLVCRGAHEYRCWNATSVNGPLARRQIGEAILQSLESLPHFDASFMESVRAESDRLGDVRRERLDQLQREMAKVRRELANVMAFIRKGTNTPSVREELARLETARDALNEEIDDVGQQPRSVMSLPTMDEIRQIAREAFAAQADKPYGFARTMRRLIPDLKVFPYRLCDGPKLVLRAHFTFDLSALLPTASLPLPPAIRDHRMVVDLFEPPQRVAYRDEVVARRQQNQKFSEIAHALEITETAAQRAAELQRYMDSLGLVDPYLPVTEPPEEQKKMRRHKHSRYRFEPLNGA